MQEIEIERFEDFEPWINRTTGDLDVLFRGQSNSEWGLETTLERNFGENIGLEYYYQGVCIALPQIETYTGERWSITSYDEYINWVKKCRGDNRNFAFDFLGYEFMAYLRHHGFPSPLLDWSRSPFVAAFFAFRHAKKGKVSIYAYCEYPKQFKSGQSGKPLIRVLGPYIRSHKRHFQQQSWYTVCAMVQPPIESEDSYYAKHESVFSETNDEQDALWKFNLPASEREKVLRHLNRYNLNAFSLFGSEESLCETVGYNAFVWR
ncbi:MAG: FRG domain-containing protein [Methylococcales bacterium]|nr:FRG domain-containing protein [Methylococcales bacterium]